MDFQVCRLPVAELQNRVQKGVRHGTERQQVDVGPRRHYSSPSSFKTSAGAVGGQRALGTFMTFDLGLLIWG